MLSRRTRFLVCNQYEDRDCCYEYSRVHHVHPLEALVIDPHTLTHVNACKEMMEVVSSLSPRLAAGYELPVDEALIRAFWQLGHSDSDELDALTRLVDRQRAIMWWLATLEVDATDVKRHSGQHPTAALPSSLRALKNLLAEFHDEIDWLDARARYENGDPLEVLTNELTNTTLWWFAKLRNLTAEYFAMWDDDQWWSANGWDVLYDPTDVP